MPVPPKAIQPGIASLTKFLRRFNRLIESKLYSALFANQEDPPNARRTGRFLPGVQAFPGPVDTQRGSNDGCPVPPWGAGTCFETLAWLARECRRFAVSRDIPPADASRSGVRIRYGHG